jgi:hypothetical protein
VPMAQNPAALHPRSIGALSRRAGTSQRTSPIRQRYPAAGRIDAGAVADPRGNTSAPRSATFYEPDPGPMLCSQRRRSTFSCSSFARVRAPALPDGKIVVRLPWLRRPVCPQADGTGPRTCRGAVLCRPVGHRPENPDVMYKFREDGPRRAQDLKWVVDELEAGVGTPKHSYTDFQVETPHIISRGRTRCWTRRVSLMGILPGLL